MKKTIGIALAIGFLSASAAWADNGPGCGLGKQVWAGQKGIVAHILAAITNNSISPASSSMTTGTSGCSVDGIIMKEKRAEVFVAVNLDNISQEMAQGQGSSLHALAGLMGCSAVSAEFAGMTQAAYPVLFTGPATPHELVAGLKREIAAHPELSAACGPLS